MPDVYGRRKLRAGIVARAITFPFQNFAVLIKLGLVPALLSQAVYYAALRFQLYSFTPPTTFQEIKQYFIESIPVISLSVIAELLLTTIVAVGIHRYIIRGEYPGWIIFRLRRFELAYVALLFLFSVAFLAEYIAALELAGWHPLAFFSSENDIKRLTRFFSPRNYALEALAVLLVLAAIAIHAMLALTMPHAAVTGRISPRASWNALKGNFWRFMTEIALLAIVLLLTSIAFSALVAFGVEGIRLAWGGFPLIDPSQPLAQLHVVFFSDCAMLPFYGILLAMIVAFFSYAYQDLADAGPRAAAEPAG